MLDVFRSVVPLLVLTFVVFTMVHVGLTQSPSRIFRYFRNWRFVLRMIVANFVAAPLLMYVILRLTRFDPGLEAGLLVFSLCAGAPFLIKLTQTAEHDLALGAFTMMLLMLVTVAYVPLVLPRVVEEVQVDGWAIAKALVLQLVLPMVTAMLVAQFAPGIARVIAPPVAMVSTIVLYAVVVVTLIGYWPTTRNLLGTGVIPAGLVFVAGAFGIGYLAGWGADHLEDVGGLGTAQRNTAAGLIVATQNFNDRNVLDIMTIASTLGMVLLLFIARALARDHAPRIVNV